MHVAAYDTLVTQHNNSLPDLDCIVCKPTDIKDLKLQITSTCSEGLLIVLRDGFPPDNRGLAGR